MSPSEDLRPAATNSRTQVNDADMLLRSLLGSAVLLLTADVAEPVLFGEGFYASLSVHPYWIIVILAAVQSGLYVGVGIAGLAALMMDWPVRPFGVSITSHYIDTAILPLQWLITALAIGVFRQGQLREETRLRLENAQLGEMSERMSGEVLRLDAALARSELAAVTRPEGAAAHHIGHLIAYLARLAEAARRTQSEDVEPLQYPPVALLMKGADGRFAVEDGALDPWIPKGEMPQTHPVAQAIRGLDGHAIVPTGEVCFVCWPLASYGADEMHGALVAVLQDNRRIEDVKAWLGLLAPLVSAALVGEDDQAAALKDPAFRTAVGLPLLLKNGLK